VFVGQMIFDDKTWHDLVKNTLVDLTFAQLSFDPIIWMLFYCAYWPNVCWPNDFQQKDMVPLHFVQRPLADNI
jgi:hypothetical protein